MFYQHTKISLRTLMLGIALMPCLSAFAQDKTIAAYTSEAPFKMPSVTQPTIASGTFSIKDYGAVGDSQKLNTEAFEKTIAAAVKAGGGTVTVPPGVYVTGPIQLQSNINLQIQAGAVIQFTADHTQYSIIKASPKSSSFVPASPIYGYDLQNVSITGQGVIDGAGESWRPVKKSKVTADQWKAFTATGVLSADGKIWWPSKEAMDGEAYLKTIKGGDAKPDAAAYLPARDFLRPYMVYLVNCERVLLDGVTIRNSPKFVFYPNNCKDVTMNKVNIFNEAWAQNGDGIDISACKNVVIYKCNVSAGDDGICMKSSGGKNKSIDEVGMENILVAGCNVYKAHGGFVIGSNTDGNIRNIYVADCNFVGTDVGIRVKSNAGRGGLVRDIYIHNISMSNIVNEAVSFDTYYEDVTAGKEKGPNSAAGDKVPEFRDFYISDISCKGAKTAISITGLPQMPVKKIHFKNVNITADAGYVSKDVADIEFKDVKLVTKDGVVTP